jgi:hypothetical protein
MMNDCFSLENLILSFNHNLTTLRRCKFESLSNLKRLELNDNALMNHSSMPTILNHHTKLEYFKVLLCLCFVFYVNFKIFNLDGLDCLSLFNRRNITKIEIIFIVTRKSLLFFKKYYLPTTLL